MGEEKVRVSGEISRPADAPILPTVNPASEKPVEKSGGIHASVYVMSVLTNCSQASSNPG
jgi:hypothetical protein